MRQIISKTTYLHKLVVLAVFVSSPLLESCQVSDDDIAPSKPQCVIQALETIAANDPTASVEIDIDFAPPQPPFDVSQMLAGLELQPFALDLLIGDEELPAVGLFPSIAQAIDLIKTMDVPQFERCLSKTSAIDLQSQEVDEHSCEIRITRLKLRGPANAALAFRDAADSVSTTSRIPSEVEIIRLGQAQSKHPSEPNMDALDCA